MTKKEAEEEGKEKKREKRKLTRTLGSSIIFGAMARGPWPKDVQEKWCVHLKNIPQPKYYVRSFSLETMAKDRGV